ncbi:MAG: 2-amino-4-hydroxy-6-hydroxymethyldihydropteridine diphosphokinase [Actinobacteria bacterium 13_2_20CM_2_66_6]|nr:MAG: 2-amino-4-hydroxy-6-hydroxymethyldihydropteridine diphosphokinase [Actinobacteria bacterium 13_2_20CM_2_66_6]
MTTVYLGLGTNLGTRSRNLSAARRRLRQCGVRILRQSRVIETEPWGVTEQPRFLNQVVKAAWEGTPRQLLRVAKEVERAGGRRRTRRWGPRVIDVDILLFGDEHVRLRDLVIPHPRIAERPFVIESLSELGVRNPYEGRAFVNR